MKAGAIQAWLPPRALLASEDAFAQARFQVRAFYGFLFALYFTDLYYLWTYRDLGAAVWIWPLAWFPANPVPALALVSGSSLVLAFACACAPESRPLRASFALAFFFGVAATQSFGKTFHSVHTTLYAAFFLIPFNFNAASAEARRRSLHWLFAAQGCFLFTYFLSGMWKLRSLAEVALREGVTALPEAAASVFTTNLIAQRSSHPVERYFAFHPTAALLAYAGAIGFELFAGWVILRPRWQRIFGAGIVAFHVGIAFCMDILFPHTIYLAIGLLLWSPFAAKSPRS